MNDVERERTCRHEAGHQVIALAVGRSSRGVTVRGGTHSAGCSWSVGPPIPEDAWAEFDVERPFLAWPAPIRSGTEGYVVTLMAGEMAELMLAPPRLGRTGPGLAERAAEQVAELAVELPASGDVDAQVSAIRAVLDTPDDDDVVKVAKLAHSAHGPDHATAASWLDYMTAQCRALVTAKADKIRRLSDALAVRDTLTGEQVAALLRE